jgi:hypothetical protein
MSRASDDHKSWGDTIRSYEMSKKSLPWQPEENHPTKTIGMLERRLKEREVNPILMQYRDPHKETQFQTQTLKTQQDKALNQTISKINKAKTMRNYNLITHTPNLNSTGPMATLPSSTTFAAATGGVFKDRNQRDYHLLSHYHSKLHSVAPLEYDEQFTQSCVSKKQSHHKPNFRPRDYNILSNQYSTNHTEREAADHEILQEKMRKKYWETHHYDLLKGQNYRESDEMKYQEEKELKRSRQLKNKEMQYPRRSVLLPSPPSLLPPSLLRSLLTSSCLHHRRTVCCVVLYHSVVYAEGNTYNILSQEITHSDHFNTIQHETLNRSLNRFKAREVFQETLTQNSQLSEQREEDRKINRISYQRWERERDRGYDHVTNQKISTTLLPHTKRPATVWEKLQVSPGTASGAEIATGTQRRGGTAAGGRWQQDLSRNHGNNLDWEMDQQPLGPQQVQGGMEASRSLAQLSSASPEDSYQFLSKSSSTPIFQRQGQGQEGCASTSSARSSSRQKPPHQIPSLDLSRASSSSANVRTGGLGLQLGDL